MNTISIKSAFLGVISVCVALLVIANFSQNRAHADAAETAKDVTIVAEQYKVIEMNSTPAFLEKTINQLGKEGWKVRTSINGTYLILAK